MTTTAPHATAPVTVGTGKAVHLAKIDPTYGPSVDCGAVRYRNITTRTITRQPAGTEVTCAKCLAKVTPAVVEAAPVVVAAEVARDEVTAEVTAGTVDELLAAYAAAQAAEQALDAGTRERKLAARRRRAAGRRVVAAGGTIA